ncbi:GNAT family N-acetyltransferase [Paenibacillus sp. BSR1-1]|uniref:GNAT family N-acetyltransferase n=1 Tax=Paenibacillus sp. BSR1-1 TaxID=3020845 RepID=UPI0025B21129|nr:GNAT family N-acetyltransferase [Paenibacillus sp. BSR1-1]MDN3015315.1 GNAT family N-acetyltransferase [Paenibacillus sp. BSR1-1]
MQYTIKKLTECTIQEAVMAWNRGFEGYFVQIEMTPDMFFNRLVNEGLSLSDSVVVFDQKEPIAIVVNGFRTVEGKKTAWNGGTGIAPEYRGKGVSQLLMEETLKIYQENGVEAATLEAIKENEKAIRLYQRFGYEIIDSLVFLSGAPKGTNVNPIQAESIRPEKLPLLPFYKENVPWQCQWQSVKSGEAQVYYSKSGNPLGYGLYKKVWNQNGQLEKVFLYQVKLLADVNVQNINAILAAITENADNTVNFTIINGAISNSVIQHLMDLGFNKTTEQVQMLKKITE